MFIYEIDFLNEDLRIAKLCWYLFHFKEVKDVSDGCEKDIEI